MAVPIRFVFTCGSGRCRPGTVALPLRTAVPSLGQLVQRKHNALSCEGTLLFNCSFRFAKRMRIETGSR